MNNTIHPLAIILGGTNPHRALIHNLKKKGYNTLLIDYNDNPPAKDIADHHIKESTLDQEKVLDIAVNHNAKLVISTCIDQANVTACYVSEKLGLPTPYSYQCALNISNKEFMKKKMLENGIPTSNFISVKEDEEYDISSLKFPLVVKPADSNGSKGVRKVESEAELARYLPDALFYSRSKKVIIEEFVEGSEIGIDCFLTSTKAYIISTHRKRKPDADDGAVIFSIGSISPADISDNVTQKLHKVALQIAKVFNLKNTPLLIQAIVNNDNVKIIEFAPRIGGGLNFKKIKLFTQFDIIDAAVNSFIGIPVDPKFTETKCYYSENHIYTEPGVFGEISGYQDLIDEGILVDLYPNKTRGMIIQAGKASKDRAASFIVKGDSKQEIIEKVGIALKKIKIKDISGSEMKFLHNYNDLLF